MGNSRILHKNHSAIVLASAGSGKTTLLKNRYIALINQGVDPKRILCITYTVNAAEEMKERIHREIGMQQSQYFKDNWYKDLKISTIHSFLVGILRAFPFEAELDSDFEVIDESSIKKLIYSNIEAIAKSASELVLTLDLNLESLMDLANQLVTYETDSTSSDLSLSKIAYKAVRKYNPNGYDSNDLDLINIAITDSLMVLKTRIDEILSAELGKKKITFSQIISKSLKLLNNPEIRDWILYKIDSGIEHIMIDEAQDITIDQINVLKPIIENCIIDPEKSVFIVGDIKQSIYSFQGSNSDYFLGFLNEIEHFWKTYNKNYSIEYLNNTYRSASNIITFINQYFDNPTSLAALKVQGKFEHKTLNTSEGKIVKYELPEKTNRNQAISSKVLDIINTKIAEGVHISDIMVLVRNRGILFSLIKETLQQNSIDFISRESVAMDVHPLFQDIITIIKNIYLNIENFSIQRIKTIYPEYEHFCDKLRTQNLSITEFLAKFYRSFSLSLRSIYPEFDRIYDIISEFLYSEYHGSIVTLLENMINYSKVVYIEPEGEGVKLMTMHGSKGLESKIVIVADSTIKPGNFNSKFEYSHEHKSFIYILRNNLKSAKFEELLQEQKFLLSEELQRLIYVAFTRAREELHIIS